MKWNKDPMAPVQAQPDDHMTVEAEVMAEDLLPLLTAHAIAGLAAKPDTPGEPWSAARIATKAVQIAVEAKVLLDSRLA